MNTEPQMVPEWHPQEAVILAWPDPQTDWQPWLSAVRNTYSQLISHITRNDTGVILLVKEEYLGSAKDFFSGNKKLLLVSANYDDTWCRDYCFITCQLNGKMFPVEFDFNGWGNKFDAQKDNLINKSVLASMCQQPLQSYPIVVEGGALEIDDSGHLLSTELCLMNDQRNGDMSLADYHKLFNQSLQAKQFTCFSQGHLEGDDTDGHIDTLVRFTPDQGLVIQSCYNRPNDRHYQGLIGLVNECKQALPKHTVFELPLPYVENEDGERLPASYANYLISNQQILCPTYRVAEDEIALATIAKAYPQMHVIGIDSYSLIQQFGSVHCISMQVPKGTLKPEVINAFGDDVTVWQQN